MIAKGKGEEAWGEPERRDPPRQRDTLTATITVRFSAEEAAAIRRLSQAEHISYSEVLRKALQNYTRPMFLIEAGTITASFAQPTSSAARPPVELGGNLPSVENSHRGLAAQPRG